VTWITFAVDFVGRSRKLYICNFSDSQQSSEVTMGVNGSSDLHPAYTKMMQCKWTLLSFYILLCLLVILAFVLWSIGSWTKVIAVLREYADGDFDFGIDYSVIVGITGLDLDDAKFIVSNMGKGDGGV
jgi:hypothetical protein